MPVVEDPLKPESIGECSVDSTGGTTASLAAQHDALHLKNIFVEDVEAVAG